MSAAASRSHETGLAATRSALRRPRRLILAVSLVFLAGKLTLAGTTYGTNDITHWLAFLKAVEAKGPIGVYGVNMPYHAPHAPTIQLYNHPPLIGYFLELVHWLKNIGFTAQFSIRATSSLADVATTFVVFELLRRRRSLGEATAAAVLVAASPILVIISGFHGNTDPLFVLFTLLSVHLLADRQRPALAGAALAIALGVKIVPVVVIPCLLVYAFTRGTRTLVRFVVGTAAVSAIYWGPAMYYEGTAVRKDVLGYIGLNSHEWGLDLLAKYTHDQSLMNWLEQTARTPIVVVCAVVPAILVWRRPATVVSGVGLALCAFLFLTPSFGTQYLAWAAAPAFLLSFGGGLAYTVFASVLLLHVYSRWNLFKIWNEGYATPFTSHEDVMGLVTWVALGIVVVLGLWRAWSDADQPGGAWVPPWALLRLGRPTSHAPHNATPMTGSSVQ